VGFARTFKEMEVVAADIPIKDIRRCYKLIAAQLKEKMEAVTPADHVRRFCSRLGLTQRDMKAAEEMAEAAVPRNPALLGYALTAQPIIYLCAFAIVHVFLESYHLIEPAVGA